MAVPLVALRERVPGLVGDSVVAIADGWDSDVLLVDGTWVVRAPRRPEVAARLPAEIALLGELGPTLPVAVPHVLAHGDGWLAYRLLAGRPMGADADPRHVAAFLSALHRFPVERAAALGVERQDWRTATAELLDAFRARVVPLLEPAEQELALRRFDAFLAAPQSFAFRPALVHADLGPEHLLCGPDGRLAGVIDWTDARIGDPALDFAWLLTGLGPEFGNAVLAAYEGEVDDGFRDRAAFYHLLGPWHEVTYGLDRDLRGYVESGLAGVRERLRES